jgi:hypothetical protein
MSPPPHTHTRRDRVGQKKEEIEKKIKNIKLFSLSKVKQSL